MSALAPVNRSPIRSTMVVASIAAVLGMAIGLAVSASQTSVALGLLLLPGLAALILRPDWLPAVLMLSVFAEALGSGSVTFSRVGGPLAVILIALWRPAWRRVRLPKTSVLVAVLAYASWAMASAVWTVNPDSGFSQGGTGYALASLGLSLAYMFGIVTFVRSGRDIRRLMWVTWALSSVVGLISIEQYLSGYSRSVGVSGDANFFAALQVVVLPFGALLAIETRRTRLRALVFLGVAVSVGSIITSLSRGGILALITVFLLLGLQPARSFFRTRATKRAFLTFMALGAGVLLIASFSALSARTSSLFSANSGDNGSGRTNLWMAALTGWREHPVLGLGFGAFIGQSDQLLLTTPGEDFSAYKIRPGGQFVHNAYLESLTELGVVGAFLFIVLLLTMTLSLRNTVRLARARADPLTASFGRAMLLSVAGFAFTSIFLSSETDRTLWILLGLTVALPRIAATHPPAVDRS